MAEISAARMSMTGSLFFSLLRVRRSGAHSLGGSGLTPA